MKISKKLREEAANLCNAMAWWWEVPSGASHSAQYFSAFARRFVAEAIRAVYAVDGLTFCEHCLEAEAMLREGWSP